MRIAATQIVELLALLLEFLPFKFFSVVLNGFLIFLQSVETVTQIKAYTLILFISRYTLLKIASHPLLLLSKDLQRILKKTSIIQAKSHMKIIHELLPYIDLFLIYRVS
jgi:hypothetical protein